MKVFIMAGGKGTRIAGLNKEIPKPMLSIAGKPILEWQIECLNKQRYNDITIIIGYLGHVIKDYLKDTVKYIEETEPLGTAGAMFMLKGLIEDDFLLINGDVIFDIDIKRFYAAHKNNPAIATIFTHPNDHPYDSGIVISNKDGMVLDWLTKEDERGYYKNKVNAGLHIFSKEILKFFEEPVKKDLDRDILKKMIPDGTLYAYDSPEYVKDVGTPERFYEVEKDIISGTVFAKNLSNKQKAVFIDRDGTINESAGFLRDINDFRLIDGVADAIKNINRSGYLAIVITNQPVVARGEITCRELEYIHNKMETLLGEQGAYLDDIFICPHHPDKGFEGEVLKYKTECNCRKPKPGMLFSAADKYNIDMSVSYMIGDKQTDKQAGESAGCKKYYKSLNDFSREVLCK